MRRKNYQKPNIAQQLPQQKRRTAGITSGERIVEWSSSRRLVPWVEFLVGLTFGYIWYIDLAVVTPLPLQDQGIYIYIYRHSPRRCWISQALPSTVGQHILLQFTSRAWKGETQAQRFVCVLLGWKCQQSLFQRVCYWFSFKMSVLHLIWGALRKWFAHTTETKVVELWWKGRFLEVKSFRIKNVYRNSLRRGPRAWLISG